MKLCVLTAELERWLLPPLLAGCCKSPSSLP